MPRAPAAPVVPSFAQPCPSPVVCMVIMAAIHHPGCRGSCEGSSTSMFELVDVDISKCHVIINVTWTQETHLL